VEGRHGDQKGQGAYFFCRWNVRDHEVMYPCRLLAPPTKRPGLRERMKDVFWGDVNKKLWQSRAIRKEHMGALFVPVNGLDHVSMTEA